MLVCALFLSWSGILLIHHFVVPLPSQGKAHRLETLGNRRIMHINFKTSAIFTGYY